ncbi:J domain-containing protein [Novipirellula artificiosorum]|uniref:Chaperone protein DnaJ n=1 Tax=Novipirellula artificiosorum TaxID=2528016 RepID=A0A5C6DJ34_9BACT|nr:J domain-containing protein [Novipirellula artificiosorum]TWU36114.1 Chaperone protein DnaJ [Novipirellula artificiosorum]
MSSQEFVDHYEVLEVSSNASPATIERIFRYLAKKYHPDVTANHDVAQFTKLVDAYETLRDPEARAAYDISYERHKQVNAEIVEGANSAGDDCIERYKLLSVLYSQRRRDFRKPGIGLGTLESLVPYPPEVVQFHLWYFREKGWVGREESGQLSITAAGVDQIESIHQATVSNHLRIEHSPAKITDSPLQSA